MVRLINIEIKERLWFSWYHICYYPFYVLGPRFVSRDGFDPVDLKWLSIDKLPLAFENFLFNQNFVCGVGREQNFVLNNKYDRLLSFLRKIAIWKWFVQYFSSYLHDKYCIFASIFWQPIKEFNTSRNWRENTIFSCQWLENLV